MTLTLPIESRRLVDLLGDPREALDVEIKNWLSLSDSEEHKATLAKALIALANHGGGFVILGYDESDAGAIPASNRPLSLNAYSQDFINGIVQRYAEPSFHCAVHHVAHPASGAVYPIISVPGGHHVPIRARRSGPHQQILQQHVIYIRKPGPKSEEPLNGREWDELIGRCVAARRDELLDRIRDVLTGRPQLPVEESQDARLADWRQSCEQAWQARIASLPIDSEARCPRGFFTFAYALHGARKVGLADLLETLRSAPSLTGWNVWWVPTRSQIAPQVRDGVIECWLGGDTSEAHQGRDSAHSDFWRVSQDGLAFLLRGHQEDGGHAKQAGVEPGTILDPTLPIWRVGEALLHASYLGTSLGAGSFSFAGRYTGIAGRRWSQWASGLDYPFASGTSRDNTAQIATRALVSSADANLVEIVGELLQPLYEQFDFSRLPIEVVRRELDRLRKRQ